MSSFAAPAAKAFAGPVGVAVNNSSGLFKGKVYVVDQPNGAVERFSPAGVWEEDVAQMPGANPNQLTVDDYTTLSKEGDVYVAGFGSGVIYRFSPALVLEEEIKGLEAPTGVAVDEAGNVFVSELTGKVLEFNYKGEPVEPSGAVNTNNTIIESLNSPQTLAASATGDIYVATGEGTLEYSPTGGLYKYVATLDSAGAKGVAVSPSDNVFVNRGGEFLDYESTGVLLGDGGAGTLSGEAYGIAIGDELHEAYLADHAADIVDVFEEGSTPQTPTTEPSQVDGSTAIFSGILASGTNSYYFAYNVGASCEGGSTTAPVGASSGHVQAEVSELAPLTQYSFCILATNKYGATSGATLSIETGAVPPKITGEDFSNVGAHNATLVAKVNPENLQSTYYYEYSTTRLASITKPQVTPEVTLAKETSTTTATAELNDLEPNAEYHFRLTAINTNHEIGQGEERTFKTLLTGDTRLPDERVYELVTPVNNQDADVHVPTALPGAELFTNGQPTELPFQVSANGSAITYPADPTSGGLGHGGVLGEQYLARRSSVGGWKQTNIQPAARNATYYRAFSSDLSIGVLASGGEPEPRLPPLSGSAPGEGYSILYACLISVSTCTTEEEAKEIGVSNNAYQPLFGRPLNRAPEEFGAEEEGHPVYGEALAVKTPGAVFAGGSANFNDLLVEANDNLLNSKNTSTEEAVEENIKREIANGEDNDYLYDSVQGQLELVDVLPDGGVVSNATFGAPPISTSKEFPEYNPPDFSNVIAEDGSRIYWTDLTSGVVYARIDNSETIQVSPGRARYWTSSEDARYAFYTEGKAEEEELYRFDLLTNTRKTLTGAGASVMGVIGASKDGQDVYLVAKGILGSAKNGEGVTPLAGRPNLYLIGRDGAPVFIATLSPEDGNEVDPTTFSLNVGKGEYGDWQPGLGNRTAEVTADGSGMVFMSNQSLSVVGYPHGYPNAGLDEVYMYAASDNKLFCVSCSASGEAPPASEAGAAAFLPTSWSDTYLPQWISEGGNRVFFDSAVPLVAQDTNDRQDVYEWEREGTSGCQVDSAINGGCVYLLSGGTSNADSWFVGADASGQAAFIVTRAQLVPQDQNDAFDLYDAQVDGVQSVSAPACTGAGCQGVPAPPPSFATPPSVTFSGVGNFGPGLPVKNVGEAKAKTKVSRSQKLAKALKVCAKKVKRKRAKCRLRAQKQYGPKSKSRAGNTAGKREWRHV